MAMNNRFVQFLVATVGVAVLVSGAAAACGVLGGDGQDIQERQSGTTAGPPPAEKQGTGELRTDPEPLTERFPALGEPADVRWMSGRYGDPRIPGPSTYWIDAVVSLHPDQVDAMVTAYSPMSTSDTPSVVDGMQEHLPAGPFAASEALDAAFTGEDWWADVFLDSAAGQLVLVATGT